VSLWRAMTRSIARSLKGRESRSARLGRFVSRGRGLCRSHRQGIVNLPIRHERCRNCTPREEAGSLRIEGSRLGAEVRSWPIVFSNESMATARFLSDCAMPMGTPFSSCSMALDGVSWVRGGLVANRSRPIRSTACYRIGALTHSLPREHSARELVSASFLVKR